MINRDELQNEIYKIISENITDDERRYLNLQEDQIIPTINLYRNIKWQLTAGYMLENCDCEEINAEFSWENVKSKEKVNIMFLGLLCIRDGINFEITKENINATWHISLIEKALVKTYHL